MFIGTNVLDTFLKPLVKIIMVLSLALHYIYICDIRYLDSRNMLLWDIISCFWWMYLSNRAIPLITIFIINAFSLGSALKSYTSIITAYSYYEPINIKTLCGYYAKTWFFYLLESRLFILRKLAAHDKLLWFCCGQMNPTSWTGQPNPFLIFTRYVYEYMYHFLIPLDWYLCC